MSPPLVLRAERRVGGGQMPVMLPPGTDGAEPGAGYDIAGVQQIEKWVLSECGGGIYDISAIDSNGAILEWVIAYEPKIYPPKVPGEYMEAASIDAQNATLQQAAAQAVVQGQAPQQAPQQQQPTETVIFDPNTGAPIGVMPSMPGMSAPAPTLPTLPQVPMTQLRPSYMWPFPATQIPAAQAANDRGEIRALEQRLHENEMKRIEEANNARLAEQQRSFQAELKAISDQLARTNESRSQGGVAETMKAGFEAILSGIKALAETNAAKPSGPSPEMLAMQAQITQMAETARRAEDENRRLREQAEARERERLAQEAHRRDMELVREQMRQSEERFNRLVDEMKANSNRGPDPVITMMQENTRMMVDYMKSAATAQDMNMRQLATQIMSPADLMRLMKDTSNGADVLTRNVAGAYSDLFTMFRGMSEHVLNLGSSGSEPPIVGVVKDAVANVSNMADKWIGGQRDTAIAAAQVEKAKYETQREAIRAQSQPIITAPPPNNGVQPSLPQPPPPPVAQPAPNQAVATQAPQPAPVPGGIKRKGLTDIEWFTPVLLPHIEALRQGVAQFMDAVTSKPPKTDEHGQLLGVNPQQTVEGMLNVAAQIEANKADVPAFTRLFMQERYADLFDVVLPDAPQIYRDDCVQLMMARLNPQPGAVATPTLAVVNGGAPANGANGAAPHAVKVPANVEPSEDDEEDEDDEDVSEEADEDGEPVEDAPQPTRPSKPRGGPRSSGTKKSASA